MTTYAEAMNAGLEAHRRSSIDREEIASIFEDLDSQIRVETKQVMRIVRSADGAFRGNVPTKYVLMAINNRSPFRSEIGHIEESAGGYPVTVRFVDLSYPADNADGLKHELRQLLSHPDTGRVIKWVLLGRSPDE